MKLLYFSCVFFLIVVIGCRKNVIDPADSTSKSPNTLFISSKSCITKTIDNEIVGLCFDSVLSDSRCPLNAECFWQGTAVARFSFSKNNIKYPFTLSTLQLPGIYSSDTILAGFKIKFINLSPVS